MRLRLLDFVFGAFALGTGTWIISILIKVLAATASAGAGILGVVVGMLIGVAALAVLIALVAIFRGPGLGLKK